MYMHATTIHIFIMGLILKHCCTLYGIYLVISRRISLIQSLWWSKRFLEFDEALNQGSSYWHQELTDFFICMVMSLFPAACHCLTPSNLVSTGMKSNNLLACRSGAVTGFSQEGIQTAL